MLFKKKKKSWLPSFSLFFFVCFYSNPQKKELFVIKIIPLTTTYSIKGKVNGKIGSQRTLEK